MARLPSTAALLALGLTLTACGPETNGLSPYANPSLASVNQPVVQRTDYVLDVTSGGAGLSNAEQARLGDWFESLQLGYGDRIFVEEAAGYGDPSSRDDIAQIAGSHGLLLSEGAPITAGAVQPGSVRVVVSRSAATVPGCPLYDSREIGERHTTAPNYGCATNSNLAAMIADPADLVLGQDGQASRDSREIAKSITSYRNRVQTGAGGGAVKSESTGGQ